MFEKLKISGSSSGTVYFDDTCNLCIRSVNMIRKFDRLQSLSYVPIRYSPYFSEQNNSIVYTEQGEIYEKSDAVLKIVKKLQAPVSWLHVFAFVPKVLRDKIYDYVARNRYRWFGQCERCSGG